MKCSVKKSSGHSTSTWSGGKTTELFLIPQDGSYAAREFELRVSTATVDAESAQFTDLPGFRRLIMPLDGEMRLAHEAHYDQPLLPFEVDIFDGGWHTRSFGTCSDFNVIHSDKWSAAMGAVKGGETCACPEAGYGVFYILENGVEATVTGEGQTCVHQLDKGDVLVVEGGQQPATAVFAGSGDVVAVMATATRRGKGEAV